MLLIKLKICYRNVIKKYRLVPTPVSIQVDYNRFLANPSSQVPFPVEINVSFIYVLKNMVNLTIFKAFKGQRKVPLTQTHLPVLNIKRTV